MRLQLRLHDGTVVDCSVTPWTTTGDKVITWLVVIPEVGCTLLSDAELNEKKV